MLTLEDFTGDKPWTPAGPEFPELRIENQIDGVKLHQLVTHADGRGNLCVLTSDRYGESERTPHVYMVTAAPRSIRAWVYHKWQSDRLAFTKGRLRIVLYDLRPDSPTYRGLNVIDAGEHNKLRLTIPPHVVHAVQNPTDAEVIFVNMPTQAYDPARPDKFRLPKDHPGIPYRFE